MWHFIQPLFAAVLGVTVSLFGLLHAVRLWPAPTVWNQVATAAPQLLNVLIVLACLSLTGAGVAMIATGIRTARQRLAQLRRLRFAPDPEHFGEGPERWG